jgi:hypothetical protein
MSNPDMSSTKEEAQNIGVPQAGKVKKATRKAAFNFEFNPITFPAHGNNTFRATVTSVESAAVLWLECKKTKQQWQATVENFSNCGPTGVPEEAILEFLKVYQPL